MTVTAETRSRNDQSAPAATPSKTLRYLPQLDGLRGLSVVLVMIHHAVTAFGGWVGVQVFFVLSGYLITSLLKQEHDRTGRIDLRRFYLRRLLRLYPPLLAALIFIFPLGLLAAGSLSLYLLQNGVAATYITNLYGLVSGQSNGVWSHTWTLAVEEQFYLVWPAIFLFAFAARGRARTVILVGAGVTSLGLAVQPPFHGNWTFNPLLTSGGLILGCALALTRTAWQRRATTAVGVAGAATVVVGVALGSVSETTAWAPPVTVLGSLLLTAHLTTSSSVLTSFMSARPLVFVGRISYELYLWHYALLISLLSVWPGHLRPTIAVAYGLAFVAAVLSQRYISTPLNRRYKVRLASTRFGTGSVPSLPSGQRSLAR